MELELSKLNKRMQAAGRVKSCCEEYKGLKTDEERFSFTLRLLQELKFQLEAEVEQKSATESTRYREEANKLFISSKVDSHRDTILKLYTTCVAFAEPNSCELAYAYGNRSALLFRARLYDHCLRDIERALRIASCPENLKIKLLSRRIECLDAAGESLSNGDTEKTQVMIDQAAAELQRCIDNMRIDENLKKKYRDNLVNKKEPANAGPQRKMFDEDKYVPPAPTDNPELPGVSAALKVSYDETFGRHVTATRKILPGELLAVQKGYAKILAPEHFYTHCSNCLRQTWSAVQCEHCVKAVYCDEKCRDEAWKNHHDIECAVVTAMIHMEFSLLGLMSLRLAVRAVKEAGGFEALKKKLETIESWPDTRTKGFTGAPPIFDESDYASVYTLTRNTEKRSGPDLFGRSFNSVYIVYFLATMTKFLGEKLSCDLNAISDNPWSAFLGGLLTTHQQIFPSNAHTVEETKSISTRERGASIIPFLSLFNHSCDFMVSRVHYGSRVALYALQPIEAGEQVYDNYGMHYALEPRFSRQLGIQRQFFFTCHCRACEEDWEMLDEIPSLEEKYYNDGPSLKVQEALKNFDKYVTIGRNSEIVDKQYVIKDLEDILKILYENVELPCREVNDVVETLKRMYALLSARYQSLCDT